MHYKYNGLSAFKQRIQRFGGHFAIPFDESNIFRPISARTLQIQCFEEGTKPPAELNQAERSEAPPREARLPPKAACAEGAPEPREGFKQKHGCDSTGRDSARGVETALGRRESVLCTYGIFISEIVMSI